MCGHLERAALCLPKHAGIAGVEGTWGVYGRGIAGSGWEMWDAGLGEGLLLGREKGEDTELSKDRQRRVC